MEFKRENKMSAKDTSISLEKHFESRIAALEKSIDSTARVLDRRLEGMNEFREALKDQASKFITRSELSIIFERIDADIRLLREYKSIMEGKASQNSVAISYIISAIVLAISILAYIKK